MEIYPTWPTLSSCWPLAAQNILREVIRGNSSISLSSAGGWIGQKMGQNCKCMTGKNIKVLSYVSVRRTETGCEPHVRRT